MNAPLSFVSRLLAAACGRRSAPIPLAANLAAGAAALVLIAMAAPARAAEWESLFDGKTLSGWRPYGRPSASPGPGWKVEDGVLKKFARARGGDIVTEKKYSDFELEWEWRLATNANSGLKYLVIEERRGAPGHEYQLIDDQRSRETRGNTKHSTASFYDVLPPSVELGPTPAGQWHSSRIVIQGSRVEHWLNGKKVLEYELGSEAVKAAVAQSKFSPHADFGTKLAGHIMLTDHGDECWFRNIRIRSLSP